VERGVIYLTYPQSIQPKVLVVEEAGQVLEAHILASLVDSGLFLFCVLPAHLSPIDSSPTSHLHRGPKATQT